MLPPPKDTTLLSLEHDEKLVQSILMCSYFYKNNLNIIHFAVGSKKDSSAAFCRLQFGLYWHNQGQGRNQNF